MRNFGQVILEYVVIVIIGDYVIKPEKREDFLKAMSEFQQKGAVSKYLAEDVDTPNTFHQVTEFDSEEPLLAIEKTELPEFMGKIGLSLADTPRFRRLDISHVETYME